MKQFPKAVVSSLGNFHELDVRRDKMWLQRGALLSIGGEPLILKLRFRLLTATQMEFRELKPEEWLIGVRANVGIEMNGRAANVILCETLRRES